jgi:SAM-dependent methyltransferase
MSAILSTPAYWDCFADVYPAFGSPLVPSAEDVAVMEAAVEELASSRPSATLPALLLGVTPAIATMRWPERSFLTAVDRSSVMAARVWPGDIPGKRRVVCGDWLALPLPPASCDVVAGDIVFNCLKYPEGVRALAARVRGVLSKNGIFVVRCFALPDSPQEDPESVFAEWQACASFHHFKLRLLMAMQPCVERGTATNDVYRFWAKHWVHDDALSARPGWGRRDIDTIELHNGPNAIYTFPTLAQMRTVLEEFFAEIDVTFASYPGGELCPTLVLRA